MASPLTFVRFYILDFSDGMSHTLSSVKALIEMGPFDRLAINLWEKLILRYGSVYIPIGKHGKTSSKYDYRILVLNLLFSDNMSEMFHYNTSLILNDKWPGFELHGGFWGPEK